MAGDGGRLPTGTVTFLFTDIEASTRLMTELGDEYESLLDLHDQLLRAAWDVNGGVEVNTEGDAFFVAFESADAAVAAAIDAQRRLGTAPWPDDHVVRVRMGLHRGFARPRRGDYVAIAVNRAARVVSTAHGGQVVLTDAVAQALTVPVAHDELGRFAVRDFDEPPVLYRLRPEGWDGSDRPLRARPFDGQNLVRPTSALIDRTEDLARLDVAVTAGRVVTIIGSGGVGKTRVAIEYGLRSLDRWSDGVWFVDLESAHTAERVANAVAEGLGAPQEAGVPAVEDVRRFLEERAALLILDNCEQACQPVAALVGEVLATSAGTAVLCTSRSPLGLRGEIVQRLDPLPFDGEASPAVELFRARAGVAADQDPSSVATLCERLDGLPLAIELAAVRASTVPASTLVEWIDRAPEMFVSEDPTLPERHRSLERVLDWSRDLLDDSARTLFLRLARFADGFELDTVLRACSGGGLDATAVPTAFWALVDQSLIVPDPRGEGSRWRLLTPIRAWAERLADADEVQSTVSSLAELYLARLGPDQATRLQWVSEVRHEEDNIRGVIRDLVGVDEPTAQALSWSLGRAHEVIGAYDTAVNEVEELLGLLPAEHANSVGLQAKLADVLLRMGLVDDADAVLRQAGRMAIRVGTPAWDELAILRSRGDLALRRGDPIEAARIGQAALAAASTPSSRARAWNLAGIAASMVGDVDDAVYAFEHEVQACLAGQVETFLAGAHGNLAEAYLRRGDLTTCAREQLACLHLAREAGARQQICYSAMVAAEVGLERDPSTAVALHLAAIRLLEQVSHVFYPSDEPMVAEFNARSSRLLSPTEQDAASERARSLSLDEVAEQARQVLAEPLH